MAPVILALKRAAWVEVRVLATAQHRGLLDRALADFGIVPDLDLDSMQPDQTLAELTARLMTRVDEVLDRERPSFVLAQGDTTTVLVTALCCFYRNIGFGHVEAGLRTHQPREPFPEEMNRVFASYLATMHFSPTETARRNLVVEGVASNRIHLTGNTVIDALRYQLALAPPGDLPLAPGLRTLLVTAHRRESFGAPMEEVCAALVEIVLRYPDVQVLFSLHPNPCSGGLVRQRLAGLDRIILVDALDYQHFVAAMRDCYLILTDSGGVQEEAPALGRPVLVLRDRTERPEAIDAGVAKLVGSDRNAIIREVSALLDDAGQYARMARGGSPYGDGNAAPRIVDILQKYLAPRIPDASTSKSDPRRGADQ